MAKTESNMLELGSPVPDFRLRDVVSGEWVYRDDFAGDPLLVMFICAHCPFVIHVEQELARLNRDYAESRLKQVAICSNSAQTHPEDRPESLAAQARKVGFLMPYLHDETQKVAKAFQAACTPDFYLFDENHKLVYRGRLDAARPGNSVPVTGGDLRAAIDRVLAGQPVPAEQWPSIGCNIKWHPDQEPEPGG
jgi:peroxiredoxin